MVARERGLRSRGRRLENSRPDCCDENNAPTTYATNQRIRPIGSSGPIPPRRIGKASYSAGEPVGVSQGIVGGSKNFATQEDLTAAIDGLLRQLADVANERGIQQISGDPEDAANNGEGKAYASYPRQFLASDNGAFYFADPGSATESPAWKGLLQIGVGVGAPVAPGVLNGALYVDPVAGDMYTWNLINSVWNGPIGGGGQGGGARPASTLYPSEVFVVNSDTSRWPSGQGDIVEPASILATPFAAGLSGGSLYSITQPNYLYLKWDFSDVPDSASVNSLVVTIANSLNTGSEMGAIAAIADNSQANQVSTSGTQLDAWIMGPGITASGSTGQTVARKPGGTSYRDILDLGRSSFPLPALGSTVGTPKTFKRKITPASMSGADLKNFVVQLRATVAIAPFISCYLDVSYD